MSRPEKVSRADRVSVLMKIIIALEPWHRLAGASLNPNAFWQNDSAPAQPWAIWLQRSLHVPNTQPALPALPPLKAPQGLAHLHFEMLVSLQKCNSTWTGKHGVKDGIKEKAWLFIYLDRLAFYLRTQLVGQAQGRKNKRKITSLEGARDRI